MSTEFYFPPDIAPLAGPRMQLRGWRQSDLAACAAMNADAQVMRYFPATLTHTETAAMVARIAAHFEQHGFGLWVLDIPGVLPFAGFVGMMQVAFATHFTPAVEIGWRLVRPAWAMVMRPRRPKVCCDTPSPEAISSRSYLSRYRPISPRKRSCKDLA